MRLIYWNLIHNRLILVCCVQLTLSASYLDVHDPNLLQNIKTDCEKLKTRYESGKELFDKFSQWHLTFKKQDEIEGLLNTDKVRKNRGGCLAGILRDQKTTNANFERYLRELENACEVSSGNSVTIDGLSPYQFALSLIHDREQRKENVKELKV
jgi:hypothetical protein